MHAYLAPVSKFPTLTQPNVLSGETLPVTLGHEFSGTIVALGNNVDQSKWRVGQNVAIEPMISCQRINSCSSCAAGSKNVCPDSNFIGIGGWGGGLSEYVAADVGNLYALPDNVPLDIGACIEPLAVAYYSVKRSGYKKGQTALVNGAGPIGLFLLKVLRYIDPDVTVLVSEPASIRAGLALKHGATRVLNPTKGEGPASVFEATSGTGVDVVFDCAGVQASITAGLKSLRPRGTFVNVALWEDLPQVDLNLLAFREITIIGIVGYDRVHAELIEIVAAGKISGIDELITSKIAIEDVVEHGFLALLKKDTQVKILVHP